MHDWCANYEPTCGICRRRVTLAREALRKARAREKLMLRAATLAYARMLDERVALAREALRKAWAIGCGVEAPPHWRDDDIDMRDPLAWYATAPSALLDGFSVDEVTEAGG